MDYQDKAEAAHRVTMERFYVPDARLFHENYPPRRGDLSFSYLWPCIGALSATNAMLGLPAAGQTYLPILGDLLDGVEQYWQAPGYQSYVASGGRSQRYYDDNAWLGIEFLQAYDTLREQRLLDRAQQVFDFVVSGWSDDLGGGLYWREGDRTTKNTCSNGPAAVLALRLHHLTGDGRYLDWARRLYDWTATHLRAPNGLYWDNMDGAGRYDQRTYTYNAGIMIQAGLLLHSATGEARYRQDALDTAASSLANFAPSNGWDAARYFPPTPWFNAILFRSYLTLRAVAGDASYATAVLANLENGWERARDDGGLLHPDWSGRSGTARGHARLLDQAPVAEIYALAAGSSAAAGRRPDAEERPAAHRDRFMAIDWDLASGRPALSPLGSRGSAHTFAARGTYVREQEPPCTLTGDLYAYYEEAGGPDGPLGFPVAGTEQAPASPAGTQGLRQLCEGSQDYPPRVLARLADVRCGAVVYWTQQHGAHATWFEIGAYYESLGGPASALGYPTGERAEAAPSPAGTRGEYQRFEGGAIYWSAPHGAHAVAGDIGACYEGLGGSGGRLGFPVSDVSGDDRGTGAGDTARQRFEGGWIRWQSGQAAQAVFD